eukprot:6280117-Alexandrium_andersonii.AAC.1
MRMASSLREWAFLASLATLAARSLGKPLSCSELKRFPRWKASTLSFRALAFWNCASFSWRA